VSPNTRWIRFAAAALVALLMVLGAADATAQQPQDEFVPVTADELNQEILPATPLVFAAYAFAWLALLAYVFLLWRRLGRVERELAEVRARPPSRR
jgi:CcmD family protein